MRVLQEEFPGKPEHIYKHIVFCSFCYKKLCRPELLTCLLPKGELTKTMTNDETLPGGRLQEAMAL